VLPASNFSYPHSLLFYPFATILETKPGFSTIVKANAVIAKALHFTSSYICYSLIIRFLNQLKLLIMNLKNKIFTPVHFTLLTLIITLIVTGCSEKKGKTAEDKKIDLITNEFPKAKAELAEIMDGIGQSIADNKMDKLISYHAYSPKFNEFKNGERRTGSEENEEFERSFFGSFTGIYHWETEDLKIDVFGDVANVTFHANFQPIIESDTLKITGQVTLLFVNTDKGWKITHEHFSPLNEG
jgi:hypothetical protein